MIEYCKSRYTAQGTVQVNGTAIPYTAVSEDFPIRGKDGQVDATMFTFSYERSDVTETAGRPVLFAWNGGPGCGSLFVHMGLLAPMRVRCGDGPDMPQTAPFSLINNDHCLLDTCDVVSIDAIGTGYARMLRPEKTNDYCSTQRDAEVFALCIRQWLTAHNRWNSPVYIMGESYGTIRTAMVANALFYSKGIDAMGTSLHVSGIINLGSALNYGQEPFPIPDDVLNLPSIAAANWYWHPEGKGSLADYVAQCEQFCYGTYVQALAMGSRLPDAQRRAVAEQLSGYTGYSVEKLLEDRLVVDIFRYPAEGMRKERRTIGIYDARFSRGIFRCPESYDFFSDDASNAQIMPAFSGAFHGIWKKQLGIDTDEDYTEIWNGAEAVWNFKTELPPIRALEKAMYRNPDMKVMFGMGYYDMLTTVGWVHYLVSHYDLPPERVTLSYYEAGHMPYIGDHQAACVLDDIRAFIRG